MSRRSYMHTVDAHSLSNRQKLACLCGFSGGGPSEERPIRTEARSQEKRVCKKHIRKAQGVQHEVHSSFR